MSNTTTNENAADAMQSVETMTRDQAMLKAAKLLRLATSSNPNEAAAAAAKAQDIMDRFKLSGGDLNLDGTEKQEDILHCDKDPLDTDGATRWKGYLASGIAKANGTKVYCGMTGYCLIGTPSDIATTRYLYTWLRNEVQRLTDEHGKGCGRTWRNNFAIGCTETIKAKLAQQKADTISAVKMEAQQTGNSYALVVVENSLARIEKQAAAVDDYGKKVLHLRSRGGSRSNYNASARETGRAAGRTINICARQGLGNGNLRLA